MQSTAQRKQLLYDKALAKPEDQRSWLDRASISQYGPQHAAHAKRVRPTVLVRDYEDSHRMQRSIARLVGEGWHIESQAAATPKKGAARSLAGGFVFFNRKPVTTVVFSRALTAAQPTP
jgi:hypothetical protein